MSNSPYILPHNNENGKWKLETDFLHSCMNHNCIQLGFGWYECNCCPYGYHIDLDFVRYCETIGRQTEHTGSIQRRRDRRRQRQSMDMLLGLAPPLVSSIEQTNFKVDDFSSGNDHDATEICRNFQNLGHIYFYLQTPLSSVGQRKLRMPNSGGNNRFVTKFRVKIIAIIDTYLILRRH